MYLDYSNESLGHHLLKDLRTPTARGISETSMGIVTSYSNSWESSMR